MTVRKGRLCLRLFSFFFLLLTAYSSLPTSCLAGDEPFTSAANWGGTGLLEIPTARTMKKDSIRFGISQVDPYRYFYGTLSPFKGFEAGGRITELLDVPSGLENQKNFKDKAFDFKYQFLSEGKYMPALALGIMDPHGTRVYPSQYLVASKQIYPFDFTLGLGNGRFGKRPLTAVTESFELEMISDPGTWLKDSQFFAGIQFAPTDKLAFMIEYSPIDYHLQTRDPARPKYFPGPVSSPFNIGFRYRPSSWSQFGVSYQRGEEIGVHASVVFDVGKPLIPIYNPPFRENRSDKLSPYHERILRALYYSGFRDIAVFDDDGALWIEAQNNKYFSNMQAVRTIIKILYDIPTEPDRSVHIVLKKNGIPLFDFSTTGADILDLQENRMTALDFFYLSSVNTEIIKTSGRRGRYKSDIRYGIRPALETFLNDPSGFFKYRVGLSGFIGYHPWDGASFIAGVEGYPANNISTSNDPLSIPVRSDIALYKSESISLSRMMYDQIFKLSPSLMGKVSAGLLEIQYAGIDAELAMPVLDGRVLLGISGSAVKKRDPDNPFGLFSADDGEGFKDVYTTAFFNTRLSLPEVDMAIDIKAGRFLAGDAGVRFTVSKVINSVTFWAWYSVTDTSVFSDGINNDYRDKGIGVSIPLRLFLGTDSRTSFSYSLSPWTRDTGQDIDHFSTLFDFIGRNTDYFIDKDWKIMYK